MCNVSFSNSIDEIEEERCNRAELLELLDHQLFHGSRMTLEFISSYDISIAEQLVNVIHNDWSRENLSAKSRKDSRNFKRSLEKVRQAMLNKEQQLTPAISSGRETNIRCGRCSEFPNEDATWQFR